MLRIKERGDGLGCGREGFEDRAVGQGWVWEIG